MSPVDPRLHLTFTGMGMAFIELGRFDEAIVVGVMHINERDGLYALSGLGRFTMTRFKLVSAAEAGYWPSRRRRLSALSPPKD